MWKSIAIAASFCLAATSASAQTLPEVVTKQHPSLKPRGEAVMRFIGIKVYDIRLWSAATPHAFNELFALELVYDMRLKGKEIASRSVGEMRDVGYVDEAQLKRWGETMAGIFPDVKPGDALIGVSIPGKEARFYARDRLIATVPDPEFAKAFFDIWLSPNTNEPRARARLLGIQ